MTKKQKKMLVRILVAAALMLILRFVPLPLSGIPMFLLWLIPYLIIGHDILRKAWKGILNRQVFDENFLMAVATLGALAIGLLKTGDYDEAVAVMLFYQIGELFQSYAVGKSRRNISELMDIRPDYANIERDGELVRVDPDEVEPGTLITVKPGEKIPIDGIVEDGESSLNTSALTGESVPRDVRPGDEVISGCINMSGLLLIRTTKVFGESTVSKVLDLVENASSRKSRSENFIARFAANAAKSKQATSRKKLLDKIKVEDIKPSSRRYPYIAFTPDREAGDQLLQVDGISKTVDGEQVLKNVSFTLKRGDKVAFVGPNSIGKTMLFKILMGEEEPDEGTFKWGVTTTQAYLPADNSAYFDGVSLSLVDWLRQYSKDPDETFVRGFLGRMLFSGEESLKKASVLSGGERVRCMLSKMMLSGANVLLMDEPTNHLDLESITALNNGLIAFGGTALFVSHDHEFVQTIANRIIDITPDGVVDRVTTYDDFLANETVKQQLAEKYGKK